MSVHNHLEEALKRISTDGIPRMGVAVGGRIEKPENLREIKYETGDIYNLRKMSSSNEK